MIINLLETFRIINGISNHGRRFFQYFSNWKLTVKADFKIKSINQLDFFRNRLIYFWYKLPNQTKN